MLRDRGVTKHAVAKSGLVLGFALVGGAGALLVLRLVVPHAFWHHRIVDVAVYLVAWGFILLTPVLAIVALVLGRDRSPRAAREAAGAQHARVSAGAHEITATASGVAVPSGR
jgi:hypothetical protein